VCSCIRSGWLCICAQEQLVSSSISNCCLGFRQIDEMAEVCKAVGRNRPMRCRGGPEINRGGRQALGLTISFS
jgi:hypothetical protein